MDTFRDKKFWKPNVKTYEKIRCLENGILRLSRWYGAIAYFLLLGSVTISLRRTTRHTSDKIKKLFEDHNEKIVFEKEILTQKNMQEKNLEKRFMTNKNAAMQFFSKKLENEDTFSFKNNRFFTQNLLLHGAITASRKYGGENRSKSMIRNKKSKIIESGHTQPRNPVPKTKIPVTGKTPMPRKMPCKRKLKKDSAKTKDPQNKIIFEGLPNAKKVHLYIYSIVQAHKVIR